MRCLVFAGGAIVAVFLFFVTGCTPHADHLELGLRDPSAVRVELQDPSPFGSSNEKMVSLEEGQGGSGRILPMRSGMLLDRYNAEARIRRKDDGTLELQFERIPEDGAPPDRDYSIRRVIWQRTQEGLRFTNSYVTQRYGTWVDTGATGWRFDRGTLPRLSITSNATFPAASGFGVRDRVHAPSVIVSTSMENVRWARAVSVEDSSMGWWFLGASILAAGISAPLYYLSGLPDNGPNGFFLGTGIGASSIGVLAAVLAIRAFARGDRETKYDLVTPVP
ncbi:MAG TPA: hypothetical protein VM925_15205 [Labilithrix sp.]|nr:hypothetical protein [Labilithrix sp.]